MKDFMRKHAFLPLIGAVSFMMAREAALYWVDLLNDTVLYPRLDLIIVLLGALGMSIFVRDKESDLSFVIKNIISYLGVMMVGILAVRLIAFDTLTSNHHIIIVILGCGLYGMMFGYQHSGNQGAIFGGILFVILSLLTTVIASFAGFTVILQDRIFFTLLGGSLGCYLYLFPIYTKTSRFKH